LAVAGFFGRPCERPCMQWLHAVTGRSVGGDDRGVSSVIGTVLMVGLAVVLVASIGLFVFGLAGGKIDMIDRVLDTIPGV
jgi:flagellin-like protein